MAFASGIPGHGEISKVLDQFLLFNLGVETFAMPVETMQEIMSVPSTIDSGAAEGHVLGVVNLRGETTPIIDLREKFDIDTDQWGTVGAIIVVEVQGAAGPLKVGMLVDQVAEVVRIAGGEVQHLAGVEHGMNAELLSGVTVLKEEIVLVVDMDRVIPPEDVSRLEQIRENALRPAEEVAPAGAAKVSGEQVPPAPEAMDDMDALLADEPESMPEEEGLFAEEPEVPMAQPPAALAEETVPAMEATPAPAEPPPLAAVEPAEPPAALAEETAPAPEPLPAMENPVEVSAPAAPAQESPEPPFLMEEDMPARPKSAQEFEAAFVMQESPAPESPPVVEAAAPEPRPAVNAYGPISDMTPAPGAKDGAPGAEPAPEVVEDALADDAEPIELSERLLEPVEPEGEPRSMTGEGAQASLIAELRQALQQATERLEQTEAAQAETRRALSSAWEMVARLESGKEGE